MKKYMNLVFVFLFFTCIGAGIFLINGNNEQNFEDVPADASENMLDIAVNNSVELVEGQIKPLSYHVNNSLASVDIAVEDENIAFVDLSKNINALTSGRTFCDITATYREQTITKSTQIIVHAKDITFAEMNGPDFLTYKSGKKANNVYETYTLKISANYSLKKSALNLDDNIVIINTNFSNEDKIVIIQYNLLFEGEFKFLIDGFSFVKNATNYISSLILDFVNVEITNNEIKLYNLTCEKAIAYQNNKFDYALLTELNNFEVIIQSENILTYENLLFSVKDSGVTNICFRAADGSGFELNLICRIEEIFAVDCQINLPSQIELAVGGSVVIQASDFLPVYSTLRNIALQVSGNLNIDGMTVSANCAGNEWIKVFLNEQLIKEIEVKVISDEKILQPNYFLSIIPPSGVTVDMDNMIIYLPVGLIQIRVYIYDEENNMAEISAGIIFGSSTATCDGCTVSINSISNSTLRITNKVNCSYYDFNLIVI